MKPSRAILHFTLSILAAIATLIGAPLRANDHDQEDERGRNQEDEHRGDHEYQACRLRSDDGDIKHVIFIIFDNVHNLRDSPNVPSDLEQMPNLRNFIRNKGTLFTNDHTILISHTAGGILTNLTGVYPDRHGQSVSNAYGYFKADGTSAFSSSFKYWTDLVDDVSATPTDPTPNMVNGDSGTPKTMPAPWVPYTRAGCDFGATALANVVLENTRTGPAGDMTKVFGGGSPEWNEAVTASGFSFNSAQGRIAQTNFVGIAIHCAKGGGICAKPANSANARADSLPDEPGGYTGFQGLFGAKYVIPAIAGGATTLNNLDGSPIVDQFGQSGFPGFDGLFASTTLSYVAQMQEAGIPITFGYISDAHDQHGATGEIHRTTGPGEASYVTQLKNYDDAFGKFFARLAAHGINKSNTLFVFTVEEGDHFVGSDPAPAGCNGVSTPCTYSAIGEINGNLTGLLATQQGILTPFTVHSDMAPTIYITGNPARTAAVTRTFGRALSNLTAFNLYHPTQFDHIAAALADPVGMKILHMVTADPQRTPTLTMFDQADYFLFAGAPNCGSPCLTIPAISNNSFAWNHGGIQPEIATTWLGIVGPGVRSHDVDTETWLDHTDVRPTMLCLLGLTDSYQHDGRVLSEVIEDHDHDNDCAYGKHEWTLGELAKIYKQINAPFGQLGMDALKISTFALGSGDAMTDTAYTNLENKIINWNTKRDELAGQMKVLLYEATSDNDRFDDDDFSHFRRRYFGFDNYFFHEVGARWLIRQAQHLLDDVHRCAANTTVCAQ